MKNYMLLRAIVLTCFLGCQAAQGASLASCYSHEAEKSLYEKALSNAAKTGTLSIVKRLIEQGVDINSSDGNGDTPLMLAVQNNQIDAVKILLNNKAQINMQNNHGETAFAQAIIYRYGGDEQKSEAEKAAIRERIIKLLYAHGADINIYDQKGLRASTYLIVTPSNTLGEPAQLLIKWLKSLPDFFDVTPQEQAYVAKQKKHLEAQEDKRKNFQQALCLLAGKKIFVRSLDSFTGELELQQNKKARITKKKAQKSFGEKKSKKAEDAAAKIALQLEREEKQKTEAKIKRTEKQRKKAEAAAEKIKNIAAQEAERVRCEQQEGKIKLKAAEQERAAKIVEEARKKELERLQWFEQAKKEVREQQALKNQRDQEARRIASLFERINSVGLGSLQLTYAPQSPEEEAHEASDYIARQVFRSGISECKEFKEGDHRVDQTRLTMKFAESVLNGIGYGAYK